jgi:hypothetical protein
MGPPKLYAMFSYHKNKKLNKNTYEIGCDYIEPLENGLVEKIVDYHLDMIH